MAISFYNAGDNAIYDSGQHFVPQEKYRLGYTPTATPEPVLGGITNIASPRTVNNGGNNFKSDNNFSNNINVGGFRTPGTGENGKYQSPSGSYITNMTSSGNMIPGLEKEDNYLQKIAKTAGRGIMGMIPGAGMALSFANKLDRFDDLNPLDQEFARMQMSQQEQNIHGTQNLPQQDRYGYNKRSALGNYSELIDKRVKIAEDFFKKNEYYRPIDQYYLDKSQDKETLQSQIDMNDRVKNHVINQRAQNGPNINNPYSKEYSNNTQSSNYTPTGPNQPDPTPTNNNDRRDTSNNTNSNPSTPGAQDSFSNKSGKGRTGYFFGGRVNYKVGGRVSFKNGGLASIL